MKTPSKKSHRHKKVQQHEGEETIESLYAKVSLLVANRYAGKLSQAEFEASMKVCRQLFEENLSGILEAAWVNWTGLANTLYWSLVSLIYATKIDGDLYDGPARGRIWA